MVRISKNYTPKDTEKYMCEKHKMYFRNKLIEWKKDLVKINNDALFVKAKIEKVSNDLISM